MLHTVAEIIPTVGSRVSLVYEKVYNPYLPVGVKSGRIAVGIH